MFYALLISFIGAVMIFNAMVMDTAGVDERRSFSEREGMIGVCIVVISLLAFAYICGMNYANAHQAEPQEKQIIESEVEK